MGVIRICPSCGLESDAIRCPRCNTLKVVGCTGSCALCGSKSTCSTESVVPSPPSEQAPTDEEHPGTPLER